MDSVPEGKDIERNLCVCVRACVCSAVSLIECVLCVSAGSGQCVLCVCSESLCFQEAGWVSHKGWGFGGWLKSDPRHINIILKGDLCDGFKFLAFCNPLVLNKSTPLFKVSALIWNLGEWHLLWLYITSEKNNKCCLCHRGSFYESWCLLDKMNKNPTFCWRQFSQIMNGD